MPWNLTIEGRGSLLARGAADHVYAPVAGIVVEVPVDHGQLVKKGDVLVRLDSKELDKERKKLFADMQGAQTQANYLTIQAQQSQRLTGNEEEMQPDPGLSSPRPRSRPKSSQEQIEIIDEQLESMTITAPQDGIDDDLGSRRRTCWAARSRSGTN